MLPDHLKKQILSKFSDGEDKLHKFLLSYALKTIIDLEAERPDLELLDLHDKFMVLYRREDDQKFLSVAKVCRKSAHKVYRVLFKKNIVAKDTRFLNVVH